MSILSHVPIAFLLLGALAPLYVLAAMLERKETNAHVWRSRRAIRGPTPQGGVPGITSSSGAVHGFIFIHGTFSQFDAAGSSQTPAFGVSGTFINGVNDEGDIVGFFSDGTEVKGFVRYAPRLDQHAGRE